VTSITTDSVQQPRVKVISSKSYSLGDYFEKMKRYGFLIGVLARRELKIKYAKTALGLGWLFLQPLALVVVYSFFFKGVIHISTGAIPYPSFVFSGLALWYIFTGIVTKSTYAIIESSDLINKVSFPRFIIPVSKVIPVLLESAALMVLLVAMLLITRQPLGLNALTALFYILLAIVFSFSIGLLCSVLTVRYRDLAHVIPFALNFGIWLTPVFYPSDIVPQPYRSYLLSLNPIAQAIEGLRNALFFNAGISTAALIAFLVSVVFLSASFYYFIKSEKRFVENL
jgi:lipopolysaccharide transport system permease protein